ncbi:MAG: UPF0182 family protein [bacterium]|nr:UPF0182 family protein [bacterium]
MDKKYLWILAIVIIIYLSIGSVAGFYVDFTWFEINKGENVFWTLFTTKFSVHTLFAIVFIAIFFLNFLLIRLLGGKGRIFTHNILDRLQLPVLGSPRKALFIIIAVSTIAAGFMMGGFASSSWKEYLMFMNSVPFTGFPLDPIFNKDIGFYVFSLPFYQFLYVWLMFSFIVIALFSLLFHILNRGIFVGTGTVEFSLFARAHLSSLLAVIVILNGLSYRLSAYELLFSQIGKFYGAGYTAVNVNKLAYDVAMVISFIAAGLLFFNIFKRSFKLPIFVLAILLPVYFILGSIVPSLLQRFVVDPNEIGKEKPYIMHNINFTRKAYDIDSVEASQFANSKNLSYNDIKKNRNIIENVRLWDRRTLKPIYKQLQGLRPYYSFDNVDVDRYTINNKKIAVNLSARELDTRQLDSRSRSWINQHLMYTHGYGLVLSRVDKVTANGFPEMLVKDIPPKSKTSIEVAEPRIYYGEHKNSYALTNTSIEKGEFDYPSGDENVYTMYSGTGGTRLGSIFKRLLFAIHFRDINILISGNISSESRILYRRNILDIVEHLTPFLDFDTDPYLVVSDGKLYWMLDAYTTTDKFPYSTPLAIKQPGRQGKAINYIRNSVKIVIDAYNGEINYYKTNSGSPEEDPIIKTYAKIFPSLFKDMSTMPGDLRNHIRYPKDIFTIQIEMLLKYHMTDPNVFYNNEDAWAIPEQKYEGDNKIVDLKSYYLVSKLPGEKESEFIQIMPFTPVKKPNMVAFLIARCDMPNYGKLKLYKLPKKNLSFGPMQVESRIDQKPEISSKLSLWNKGGSRVLRGNMLVIPIEESLLFIEPLYLKAKTGEMPQLGRVIVAFSDKLVMARDLETALMQLFEGTTFSTDPETDKQIKSSLKELAGRALSQYSRAEENMKKGNWAEYGSSLKKMKETLVQMKSTEE